jgi:hypothetical protein
MYSSQETASPEVILAIGIRRSFQRIAPQVVAKGEMAFYMRRSPRNDMKVACPTASVELPEVTSSFDAKRSHNLIPEIAHVLVETSGGWLILTRIFVRVRKRESRWAGDRLLGL